ncbi:helix-turn-helix domain-containing protein [Planktothrix mougeotii]|uniref:Helix-turn-helix domain-containing protein n=1 Tax=Planktothrix mougeotii LEGE 06226 TaxID=1828728 RepID=A0ABR9U9Y3_9CYAN|nr:helix-turn-helix domain-containing protein [Planktothrix mougeotii]MBE9143237.1 helix-turn-helix domain-containing protein [Planktothrix mougeotii LEGE 06226]
MAQVDKMFSQAAQEWDLDSLYADLASAKGKHLTPIEKAHLRGLLSGCSPSEIAEKLDKIPRGVESDLCATIYKYVKYLLDKTEKVENWRKICEWLDESGYKSKLEKLAVKTLIPEQSVINITTINIDQHQIVFHFNLKIPTSELPELSIPDCQTDKNSDNNYTDNN